MNHHRIETIHALLLLVASGFAASFAGAEDGAAATSGDGFRSIVAPFLRQHCQECHGPDLHEANLTLHDIDPDLRHGDLLETWRLIDEQMRFRQMPPPDHLQPGDDELQAVRRWIRVQLLALQTPGAVSDPKLLLPEFGNYVDHDALFGTNFDPVARKADAARFAETVIPAAPRLWRMRPEIYQGFTNSIAERPKGVSQPFSVLPGEDFKDFAAAYFVDEPTTDLLFRNAELVIESQTQQSNKYRAIRTLVDSERAPTPEQAEAAIREEFQLALRRQPTSDELPRFLQLYRRNVETGGHVIGGKKTLLAVLMQPEAIFRMELGQGHVDEYGRRRLSPSEITASLSYALRNSLDRDLLQAADEQKLQTREQVAAQVQRMLDEGLDKNPRILQFFREYFGYPRAEEVFKDPPELRPHEARLLVSDLEHLIRHILLQDRDVLKELLTTRKVFVSYSIDSKTGEPANAYKFRAQALHADYPAIYGLPPDWKWMPEQPIELLGNDRAGVLTHPAWLVAWSGNFDNEPVQRGKWIRTHLLGGTVPDVPIGVDARIPDDEHKSLRERLDMVSRKSECWRCHRKMNNLGLPFEQYDHYGWLREIEAERPAVTTGAISFTDIKELDRSVSHPVELAERLAESEYVEQVFVRHVFRFFLGRNETLGDACTLREAHAAYRQSGGSFSALVASLLTSDSFLLRADPPTLSESTTP